MSPVCCCSLNFLIEVACNKVLGEGQGHFIGPPDDNVTFTLNKCHLTVRNKSVYKLLMDLKILHDISKVHHNNKIDHNIAFPVHLLTHVFIVMASKTYTWPCI